MRFRCISFPDMAPPSTTSNALACMAEIQEQCFKMGIPLRTRSQQISLHRSHCHIPSISFYTINLSLNILPSSHLRHREVAPGQYEFAPLFGTVTTQIDQNLVVMQV